MCEFFRMIWNDDALFLGVVTSLIAWFVSLIITYFISRLCIVNGYKLKLEKNLEGITKAIKYASTNTSYEAVQDAEKILAHYRTYQSNYDALRNIVYIQQLEDINKLMTASTIEKKQVLNELDKLASTWEAVQKSLINKELQSAIELGIKKNNH